MPMDLIAAVGYGGYISLWKLLLFVLGFAAWAPLVKWVFTDTQAVRANTIIWTLVMTAAGVVTLFLWMLIPAFFIGLLFYLIVMFGISMAYITHRNSLVADFEKVLTADHFKSLLTNPNKKLQKVSHGISFITANGNDVPMPDPKTREMEGFIIACDLIDDAVWHRADIVQFIPQKEEYAVVYEIDGTVSKQDPKLHEDVDNFIYYVKQLAGLEVEEKRKPQHGRFSATLPDNVQTRWELTTSGSTAGEKIKIEQISDLDSRKIEDLGLNENQLEPVQNLRNLSEGLIIVSGPKRSGLTSTLYTLLGNHDAFLNNINTLEKKPSAQLQNITQFTYSMGDTGTETYARRLQSVFRKGPDIVGVSDCEDAQTAALVVSAANDGRIVYVGIEADSVNAALGKLLKWIKDKNQIADSLTAVINQRLVRKLCDECRQAYNPNPAIFKKFNISPGETDTFYRPGEIEYDKHGKPIVCEKCQGTGFYGRMGLFETIHINDELRESIRKAKSVQDIMSAFRRTGMLYMQEQSIKKIATGETSINEVIREFSTKS